MVQQLFSIVYKINTFISIVKTTKFATNSTEVICHASLLRIFNLASNGKNFSPLHHQLNLFSSFYAFTHEKALPIDKAFSNILKRR